MKREIPFLSPISIAFTVIVFAILGLSLWLHGGLAFSPGAVTAQARPGIILQGFTSHADFEQQCKLCHQPLGALQADLCMHCHDNILDQQHTQTGTHGQIDTLIACRDCHPEHRGASFDPVAFAVIRFDHSQTHLPLTGAHAILGCESCHIDGNYQLSYAGCTDCHAEPDIHAGMFEENCDACHTDLAWRPVLLEGDVFDHQNTGFSLVHHQVLPSGQDIACVDCHAVDSVQADPRKCTDCHTALDPSYMKDHLRTVGPDCLQCHDGTDRMAGFDHAAVFPLDGQHRRLECSACHANFHFGDMSGLCIDCHAEPDIHAGFFGTQCQRCHTTQAWTPALLLQHTFSLDHGEGGDLTCQTCHVDTYSEYTCYSCHEHQPEDMAKKHLEEGISAQELIECAACHPTGREKEGEHDGD
ncbi:MAG TPA: cytochrome c3 family protein [Levilinea sp.]|nr:cytochrome c3 family protein [Levilinea sp.]